jgi:hypothetical protein
MDSSIAVSWHIPHISISPAPREEAPIEPYSPFSSMPIAASNEDAFRPHHLTPPPTFASFDLLPLYPSEDTIDVGIKGREHYEETLEASVNAIDGNKAGGLQKETARNSHINRHGMSTSYCWFVVSNNPSWQRIGVPCFSLKFLRHLPQLRL